jgi:hypothetical protein
MVIVINRLVLVVADANNEDESSIKARRYNNFGARLYLRYDALRSKADLISLVLIEADYAASSRTPIRMSPPPDMANAATS